MFKLFDEERWLPVPPPPPPLTAPGGGMSVPCVPWGLWTAVPLPGWGVVRAPAFSDKEVLRGLGVS